MSSQKSKKAIAMEELTPKQLLLARDWIKDCCPGWCDLDKEEVNELTDTEVTRGIRRHFSGGISEFKSNTPEE
jgi:hypothetical protein